MPLWLNPLGDLGVLCGEQLEHPLPADRLSGDLVVEPLRQGREVIEDGGRVHLPRTGQRLERVGPRARLAHRQHRV